MKLSIDFLPVFTAAILITLAFAHPERLTTESSKREPVGRGTNRCAAQIEARKMAFTEKRAQSLYKRRAAKTLQLGRRGTTPMKRDVYATVQNDTCVLAPEAVWGPYAVDGEILRHDIREGNDGVDLYLDIGVIDTETCEPLPDAYLTIWHCNATGTYSGFTGIDPNTAETYDGVSSRFDGTTDDETFLRGVMPTNEEGVAEFLTIFPGYYITRSTHIHLTVQANVTGNNTNDYSYSEASVQHIGQLFFDEAMINSVYELAPYHDHLSTLNRTLNTDDGIYVSSNEGNYSSVVSVQLLGEMIADGLVGYITVGVNSSAAAAVTTGGSVNPIGLIPTVSIPEVARQSSVDVDIGDGYVY